MIEKRDELIELSFEGIRLDPVLEEFHVPEPGRAIVSKLVMAIQELLLLDGLVNHSLLVTARKGWDETGETKEDVIHRLGAAANRILSNHPIHEDAGHAQTMLDAMEEIRQARASSAKSLDVSQRIGQIESPASSFPMSELEAFATHAVAMNSGDSDRYVVAHHDRDYPHPQVDYAYTKEGALWKAKTHSKWAIATMDGLTGVIVVNSDQHQTNESRTRPTSGLYRCNHGDYQPPRTTRSDPAI
jgi:hypothetical protein